MKMSDQDYFHFIIEKQLNGTITPDEAKFLEQFERKMHEKNKAMVFSNNSHREAIGVDILSKINSSVTIKRKSDKRRRYYSMAASIAIIFSVGLSYVYFNNDSRIVYANNTNAPKKYILSDGSTITLNQNSRLFQDENFNTENRFVELEGEAYFEIEKNKSLPFIIKTNEICTKVVGTKFNISTNYNFINVSVNEGHVKVYDNKDTLDATPNQQITYSLKNKKLTEKLIQSDLFNMWTKNEFELNSISIIELSRVFESVYNYQIDFKNEKVKCKEISITFNRSESIDAVLEKINLINEFKLTKKPNGIIEADL